MGCCSVKYKLNILLILVCSIAVIACIALFADVSKDSVVCSIAIIACVALFADFQKDSAKQQLVRQGAMRTGSRPLVSKAEHNISYIRFDVSCLQNRTVVYIGDSTSRYEYLTLCYLLEYGKMPLDSYMTLGKLQVPSILGEWEFANFSATWQRTTEHINTKSVGRRRYLSKGCIKSVDIWDAFYQISSLMIKESFCDCWRGPNYALAYENRRYRNDHLNVTVMFFQWFSGLAHPRGTFDIRNSTPSCPVGFGNTPDTAVSVFNTSWQKRIDYFMMDVLSKLQPSDVFVNAQFHKPGRMFIDNIWKSLAIAGARMAASSGAKLYWRTSPVPLKSRENFWSKQDPKLFLQHGWLLYDAAKLVRTWQKSSGLSDAVVFRDSHHLFRIGNCHLVGMLLDSILCPKRIS